LAIPSAKAKEVHSFLFFILVCTTFAFAPPQRQFSVDTLVAFGKAKSKDSMLRAI